jgi:hypothetical protein
MENAVDTGPGESESRNIQTLRECLERHFVHVTFSQHVRPTFAFKNNDGKVSWLLVINREFLSDCMSIEELRRFVEERVIKKIHANPGKRIQISKYRDITVEEKHLS